MTTPLIDLTFPGTTAPGTITPVDALGDLVSAADLSGTVWHHQDGYLVFRKSANQTNQVAEFVLDTPPQDQQIVVRASRVAMAGGGGGGNGPLWAPGVHMQTHGAGAAGAGHACMIFPGYAQVARYNYAGWSVSANPVSTPFSAESWVDPGTDLILEFTATGTNPRVLRLRILRADTNAVLFDQTGADTGAGFQAAGNPFLWTTNAGANSLDYGPVSRVQVYEPSGAAPLLVGAAEFVSATATAINLTMSAALGGTAPLAYTWRVSADGFATPGTLIEGATTRDLNYTAPDDAIYYFRGEVTDADDATDHTNTVGGCRQKPALKLGFIGDSVTALGPDGVPTAVCAFLSRALGPRSVTFVNAAVSASSTTSWDVGSAYLEAAIAAFLAGNVTHILFMLGVNEANLLNLNTSLARLAGILDELKDRVPGVPILLNGCTYIKPTTVPPAAFLPAWNEALDSLCDGVTVFKGDRDALLYLANNTSEIVDTVHLATTGYTSVGQLQGAAFLRTFFPGETTGSGGGELMRRIGGTRIRGGF